MLQPVWRGRFLNADFIICFLGVINIRFEIPTLNIAVVKNDRSDSLVNSRFEGSQIFAVNRFELKACPLRPDGECKEYAKVVYTEEQIEEYKKALEGGKCENVVAV